MFVGIFEGYQLHSPGPELQLYFQSPPGARYFLTPCSLAGLAVSHGPNKLNNKLGLGQLGSALQDVNGASRSQVSVSFCCPEATLGRQVGGVPHSLGSSALFCSVSFRAEASPFPLGVLQVFLLLVWPHPGFFSEDFIVRGLTGARSPEL